jgi:hypothetical protein
MNCPKCGSGLIDFRSSGLIPGWGDAFCVKCKKRHATKVPSPSEPRGFDGDTYEPAKDRHRLSAEYTAVWNVMLDGQPHTLAELSERTGYPEPGISARLRDFRKARNGSHTVERKRVAGGLFEYRLIPNEATVHA